MTLANHIKNMLNTPSDSQLLSTRLATTTVNKLDELAQELEKTRSELITTFIEGGIEELERQLEAQKKNEVFSDENLSANKRYFLLNTNFNNSETDHYTMLENEEASAFYEHWKENITHLREGDIVFLYQSSVGIVAYGFVSGDLIKRDHKGNKNEWYSKKLDNFVRLNKPLTAKGCKEVTKTNFNFRMTMVSLSQAQGDALMSEFTQA
ncbi:MULTISPECIES: hypothetical protein [Vibrio]|uniref:hypothetical protein n=1 Tax=Vibrio TaxID=662 RepID=UPI001E358835|nr:MULTISPECIES: hypothetical protein [Vibrio]MCD1196705.1 hypothetical protein [Vibrio cholerae]MCD1200442.1 hypothetical protein [Vibrio cholerae]MCD1209504.1 hypothetical protein [Vibrio cholerae]MCD1213190.1 hypothetical protein [Vibrio cholerae]MCD1227739.1 hypothetical protein [Vibrio cholerae]